MVEKDVEKKKTMEQCRNILERQFYSNTAWSHIENTIRGIISLWEPMYSGVFLLMRELLLEENVAIVLKSCGKAVSAQQAH